MFVRHAVDLTIRSDVDSPAAISELLQTNPTRQRVRGSAFVDPPRPKWHFWELDSGVSGQRPIGEHTAKLLGWLAGRQQLVRALAERGAEVTLRVVRGYYPSQTEQEGDGWSFDLEPEALALLGACQAGFHFPEYDFSSGWDEQDLYGNP